VTAIVRARLGRRIGAAADDPQSLSDSPSGRLNWSNTSWRHNLRGPIVASVRAALGTGKPWHSS